MECRGTSSGFMNTVSGNMKYSITIRKENYLQKEFVLYTIIKLKLEARQKGYLQTKTTKGNILSACLKLASICSKTQKKIFTSVLPAKPHNTYLSLLHYCDSNSKKK